MPLPIEVGWSIAGNTGWGLYGLGLALGLARHGRPVHATVADSTGIAKTLWPQLWPMGMPGNESEYRIRFDPYGNHKPPFQHIPNRYRVLLAVFEDTEAVDVEIMSKYDLILAPSRWVQSLLAAKGLESTLFHQGVDFSLFRPKERRRSDGRLMVFSGGKLEFRKANDVVVAAFRAFLQTPEGKDAILVTASQNPWPATMDGIWSAGHVKGVPTAKGKELDISSWMELNDVPRGNHIDLGMLTQAELANAIGECDVALFPNRCEGATSMPLVETLAMGIPCIAAAWTGQKDVTDTGQCIKLEYSKPVTIPCRLYRGMEGWSEPDVDECVAALQRLATSLPYVDTTVIRRAFSWTENTADLHHLLALRTHE